jgi:hypothetical protein
MNLVCPDCKEAVETIIACGCRDYFCNHCNQMVSKKRVIDLDAQSSKEVPEVDSAKQAESN